MQYNSTAFLSLTLFFKKLTFPRIIQNNTVLALFFYVSYYFEFLNIYVDLLMNGKIFSMLFLCRLAANEESIMEQRILLFEWFLISDSIIFTVLV